MNNIKLVETFSINNEKELKVYHQIFISEGFEGTMVRTTKGGYKLNGRSSNLLKYKDFQDITATIIDVIPSEKRPGHGTPVLKFFQEKLDGDVSYTFKAGIKMPHAERVDLLINKHNYIGKTAEIRFFEYTNEGRPRFPIMVGIRLDC